MRRRGVQVALVAAVASQALSGCGAGTASRSEPVGSLDVPQVGRCRVLAPADLSMPTNDTEPVVCEQPHTAETFAAGELPAELTGLAYESEQQTAFAYQTCSKQFQAFLDADESTVLRTVLSWVWFRPSRAAWAQGARWYRCDVVGGGEQSRTFAELPASAADLLGNRPEDEWMVCVDGASVQSDPKIACTQDHSWRAVTTIIVGEQQAPYPGDDQVQKTTRDYCSESVAGWLGYPGDYDFAYTWFHEPQWRAGNRRSICWAATTA